MPQNLCTVHVDFFVVVAVVVEGTRSLMGLRPHYSRQPQHNVTYATVRCQLGTGWVLPDHLFLIFQLLLCYTKNVHF